jgi:hypothetical protein
MVIEVNPKTPAVTYLVQFSIDTQGHEPVFTPPRQYHATRHDLIDKEVPEMEKNGIVRRVSNPTWGSPAQSVRKPDGSIRVIIVYTQINKVTTRVNFNPYSSTEILHSPGRARIFSTLYLASGYWQIYDAEDDKCKTALTCRAGVFEF